MVVDFISTTEEQEFDAARMSAALRARNEHESTHKLLQTIRDEVPSNVSRMRAALRLRKEWVQCETQDDSSEEKFQVERMMEALRLRRELHPKNKYQVGHADERDFDASRLRMALKLRKECILCPTSNSVDSNQREVERMKVAIQLRL